MLLNQQQTRPIIISDPICYQHLPSNNLINYSLLFTATSPQVNTSCFNTLMPH